MLGAAAIALVPLPLAGCTGAAPSGDLLVHNPLVRQRVDPHISRDEISRYLLSRSVPEYARVVLRGAAALNGLGDAEQVTRWRRPGRVRLVEGVSGVFGE